MFSYSYALGFEVHTDRPWPLARPIDVYYVQSITASYIGISPIRVGSDSGAQKHTG